MHDDLAKAKRILQEKGYTCVLYADGVQYHSHLRGVKPLIMFLESKNDFKGFYAADKTVGAGAAHLYVLLGVKAVWANVVSKSGRDILEQNGIAVFCEKTVPYIINRAGDGMCPIENAVRDVVCSEQAAAIMKQTLQQLMHQ
ncbi:MAG: DUF1893 domain-containing protein [Clostridia bacterium]|nr:DUF1893 domain-containing protein [Clostridia bacterium]